MRSGKVVYAFLYGQASADVLFRDGLCLFGSQVLVVVEAAEPSAASIVTWAHFCMLVAKYRITWLSHAYAVSFDMQSGTARYVVYFELSFDCVAGFIVYG